MYALHFSWFQLEKVKCSRLLVPCLYPCLGWVAGRFHQERKWAFQYDCIWDGNVKCQMSKLLQLLSKWDMRISLKSISIWPILMLAWDECCFRLNQTLRPSQSVLSTEINNGFPESQAVVFHISNCLIL